MPALMKGFSTAFCFPVLLFSIARVLSSGINYFQGGQAAYGNNGYAGLVLSLDISPAWTSSNEKNDFWILWHKGFENICVRSRQRL